MQMNDAMEPLKIIIGAATENIYIYFLIFNGVNAYRQPKKKTRKKTMQMQLSAEQNVEMKSLRRDGKKGLALGTEIIVISTLVRFRFRFPTYC